MRTLPSWLARGCLPLPGSCPPRAPEGCSRVVTAVFRACLSPAVASASEYAHRGLDKLEENLPILQQHTEKVTGARRREPPRGRGLAGCRVWRPPGLGQTSVVAYPPTPLSCSTSARGSRANVLNTSPIFSEPAHIFPPCPEEKPQPTRPPPPPRPRHPPHSPLSGLAGLRPRQAVPRVPIRTGHSEGDRPRPCGACVLGRAADAPGSVAPQGLCSFCAVVSGPLF